MSEIMTDETAAPVIRVDKFAVPAAGREEFLARVFETHAFLRAQKGFVRGMILEQDSGPGRFNFVTVVEWESVTSVNLAATAVARYHHETGFDRQRMLVKLGIDADLGNYRRIDLL